MHRKIDIYMDNTYLCSTNQSRTCREAIGKLRAAGEVYIAGRRVMILPTCKLVARFWRR